MAAVSTFKTKQWSCLTFWNGRYKRHKTEAILVSPESLIFFPSQPKRSEKLAYQAQSLIWHTIFSSARSSHSYTDLQLIYPTQFFRSHRSSIKTTSQNYSSHFSAMKGTHSTHLLAYGNPKRDPLAPFGNFRDNTGCHLGYSWRQLWDIF